MERLIRGLKARDPRALEEAMERFKHPVCNYVNMVLHNRAAAEDITQETFIKVYFKAHTLRSNNLKAWIFTIATNLALAQLRKRKLRRLLHLAALSQAETAAPPGLNGPILFEQLMALLPDKYRLPLLLKDLYAFSYEEISAMLNKPEGTVKSLVHRAKKLLKQGAQPRFALKELYYA